MLNQVTPNEVLFLQQKLIRGIFTSKERFPKHLINAFYSVPRHLFAETFFLNQKECELTEESADKLLPLIYQDQPLIIYHHFNQENEFTITSTISQPSLVLRMLHWLDLKPGQRILEIGGGSGWNAALMGAIVGSDGLVVSLEIIDELVLRANRILRKYNFDHNVMLLHTDGSNGYEKFAPYDRGVFTAGSCDLPKAFFSQMKNESILLLVLKNIEDADRLFVLKKCFNHFVSLSSIAVRFVPLVGGDFAISHQGIDINSNVLNPVQAFKKRLNPKRRELVDFNSIELKIFDPRDVSSMDFKPQASDELWDQRGESLFLWKLKKPISDYLS